jgi:hypothetical protein
MIAYVRHFGGEADRVLDNPAIAGGVETNDLANPLAASSPVE